MKAFRFSLERVRRWRSVQLEIEKRKLSALVTERTALAQHAAALSAECTRKETALIHAAEVRGEIIGSLEAYRSWVKSQLEICRSRIAEVETRIEAQRRSMMDAQRNVDLLDKLKERALAEWRKAAEAEVESLASEAYLAKWQPE